jgi:hypothetical protein
MNANKSVDDALNRSDVMRSYDVLAVFIIEGLSAKLVTRKQVPGCCV